MPPGQADLVLTDPPNCKSGTVQRLAEEVKQGLRRTLARLRKTVVNKLSLAVGAMIEGRTPNTAERAHALPLPTERQGRGEQWLRRLLKNPRLESSTILEPFARAELAQAARNGQTVILSLNQTDLGNRMAVLMVAVDTVIHVKHYEGPDRSFFRI